MADDSTANCRFTSLFNEAKALFYEDKLEESIEKCCELLNDSAAPRRHQVKAWLLLGCMLPDRIDAEDCLIRAETMWRMLMRWHPPGGHEVVTQVMAEIRRSLDKLSDLLNLETEASDMVVVKEEVVQARERQHGARVAGLQADMEHLIME